MSYPCSGVVEAGLARAAEPKRSRAPAQALPTRVAEWNRRRMERGKERRVTVGDPNKLGASGIIFVHIEGDARELA
jgi:hypothetical protein